MKRLLLPAVLLAAGVAAFFLLQRDDPAPDWATPATTPTADPTAPPATLSGGTTDTSRTDADASTPRAGARTALGERAVHLRIRGRFEADPRLPLSGGVVVVVDREVAGSRRTTGPFGDAYSGLAVLAPHARERGRAEVASDGSFAVEVRTAGEPDQLTVRLDHDHYFLPTLPAIPIGDGSGERDLGSLHPVLGALVIGRLVDFPAPEETTVRLRAEMDMMAPARDPQLFAAQVAGSQRPPVHGRRDGTFALRAVPPTPGANVHAAHGDLIGTSTTFPLTAGETREVTVYAQQATTLLATVRDERGNPVEGAAVEVQATAGAFIGGETARAARTDAAGVAAVRGIVPGDARIHVQCAGFVGARQTETLPPGEVHRSFVLARGAELHGRVVDDTGASIAGARIGIQPTTTVPMFGDASAMLGADVLAELAERSPWRSDADGRFTLTGMTEGRAVTLVVAHDSFAPAIVSGAQPGGAEVVVVLPRRAEVSATVLDGASRAPMPAFSVEVLSTGWMGMEFAVRSEQVRDPAGRFALALSPERFLLRITAPGHGHVDRKVHPAPGERVDLGEVVLEPAAAIEGKVVDEHGDPVRGARVRVRRGGLMDHEIFAHMRGDTTATASSGADGSFRLTGITPGTVRLLVSHTAFAAGESTRIEVASGQTVRDVVVVLDHGGSIRGRLLLPYGARRSDWDVYCAEVRGGRAHHAAVAVDGTFHVGNLAPGAYSVQAIDTSGFARAMQEAGLGDRETPDVGKLVGSLSRSLVQAQCQVRKGETTEVELDATGLEGSGAVLQVDVFVGDERLPDGFVEVRTAGHGGRLAPIVAGRAEIAGLQPGTVHLQVRSGMGFAAVGEPQAFTIERPDEERQVELRLPGGTLAGRVLDAESGEPLRGVTVRAHRAGAVASHVPQVGITLTDTHGAFSFRGLQPGTYSVVADDLLSSDPERSSGRIDGLQLAAGERREDLVLRARTGARASVTVRDERGVPVPHALVMLVDADGQPAATLPIAITDVEGRADLAGLPDAPVRAVARAPGLAPGISDLLPARSGAEVRLEVTLRPGTAVALRVEDARGEPLRDALVAIRLAAGPWLSGRLLGITPLGGDDLDLGALPPGPVRVRVEHPRTGTFEVERTVPAGRRTTLVVSAPR